MNSCLLLFITSSIYLITIVYFYIIKYYSLIKKGETIMKHCINCGNELENSEQFCTNCGTKQEAQHTPSPESKPENHPPEKRKKMSTKTKMIFISLIALIVLLFVGYKIIEYINRPTQLVQTFIEDVEDQNYKAVQAALEDSGTDIKLNEQNVKAFLTYLEEQPDYWNTLKQELNETATQNEKDQMDSADQDDASLLTLATNGKKWLLFNHYVIKPKEIYVKLTSDMDNTVVHIGAESETKLKKAEKTYTAGPFLPYEQTAKATYKTDFSTTEDEAIGDPLTDLEGKYLHYDFSVQGNVVYISTDDEDATIFVNGKNTNEKVGDDSVFGPINTDGTMRIHLERKGKNGKKEKSNNVTLQSSDSDEYIELYFDEDVDDSDEEYETSTDFDEDDEEDEVTEVIEAHYKDIENGDFQEAYDAFSNKKRSAMSKDNWAKEFPTVYVNEATVHNVIFKDDTHAIADITLYSESEDDDGTELEQTFTGTWDVVKENGNWKLDSTSLKEE